ncbi:hypothetical protein FLA_2051 [Filimonas lacunae]|nr:hypothetical protein FLA_2051 [Filimonas lacunae]
MEYAITEEGFELKPVLISISMWGAKHKQKHTGIVMDIAACTTPVEVK